MNKRRRIFVGQYADVTNNNPQALNTRALLSRFKDESCEWLVPYFRNADPSVLSNPNVTPIKLWPWRFWTWHKFLLYQLQVDAVFYPGPYWFDDLALQLRRLTGRKVPVITTLEGLGGNDERQNTFSEWAGHPVYCQQVPDRLMQRIDRMQCEADHIIAISPFLARMGSRLYGEKFSELPLGIDGRTFFPNKAEDHQRFRVMGAGRLYDNKRPGLFLELARRFPQAVFVWFGEGELRENLIAEKARLGLENVSFPGAVANNQLAAEMRRSDLFVLPSSSEGVPKVTQEATACGLPVVIFGFYEAPSVVNGENGFVVWRDEEMFTRVGELIGDPEKAQRMGECGFEMAKGWDWDNVAAQWENVILKVFK